MTDVVTGEIQRRFERRIRTLTGAGIALPAEFTELQSRLQDFRKSPGTPVVARIVDALIRGDESADLDVLRAVGLAELTRDNELRRSLEEGVRDGVHERLRDIYGKHAVSNYELLAARFDEQAQMFTAAADTVDIEETDPDILTDGTAAELKAWKSALVASQAMTALMAPLAAAACLAGALDDTHADTQLALVVDTSGHDRAALWSAWDTEETQRQAIAEAEAGGPTSRPPVKLSRTGKWGALHKMGATLRASPINEYVEYGRRAPDNPEFAPSNVHAITHVSDLMLNTAAT